MLQSIRKYDEQTQGIIIKLGWKNDYKLRSYIY